MKKNFKIFFCALLAGLMLLLCGCQQTPEAPAVVSKNDGSFDAKVVQSATEPTAESAEPGTEPAPTKAPELNWQDQFTSTDGSVNFTVDLRAPMPALSQPVVEVAPHYLTSEDVRRVANVLFGEAEFYESQPLGCEVLSKTEIQDCISYLSKYATQEGLDSAGIQRIDLEVVRSIISGLNEAYESAPKESTLVPCDWRWKPTSYYFRSPEELASMDTSQDNQDIHTIFTYQGRPYELVASTRNKKDFKINNICVMIQPRGPISFEFLNAEMMQKEPPTQQTMDACQEQVQKWLDAMGLGQWQVDVCREFESDYASFTVQAVPVFEGAPAARRPQLYNLKSKEVFASNYYLTDISFLFTAGGELKEFWLYSPVDVKSVVNPRAATLSMEELIARAREHLSLSDLHQYGIGETLDGQEESLSCNVSVTRMEYGLSRVKVPGTDESYYYVPAMTLYGRAEYIDKEIGDLYYRWPWEESADTVLLILNAIDGSVIDSSGV